MNLEYGVERINLIPPEVFQGRKNRRKNALLGAVALLLLAVIAGTYLEIQAQVQIEQTRLEEMQAQVSQLKSTISTFQVFQAEEAALASQQTLISTIKSTETMWPDVLDDISLLIPSDVQLDNFGGNASATPASVQVSGRASSYEGVASFIVRLENSERFTNVTLGSIASGTGLAGETSVTFSMSATVVLPGAAGTTATPTTGG